MNIDKLTNDEKAYIIFAAETYNNISENMKKYSLELSEIQDKITNETKRLTEVREKEQEFQKNIEEKYGFKLDTLEIIEMINETKK